MSDNDQVTSIILERLQRIENKLDTMQAQGCSKADNHARMQADTTELFQRMNIVERAQAEGRGRLAVVMLVAGSLIALFFQWVGKQVERGG